MTMTVPPVSMAALWSGVDRLTEPARHGLRRDDGSTTWTTSPCLLDLAAAAAGSHGGEAGAGPRWGTQAERTPVDLELVELVAIIARMTVVNLVARGQLPSRLGLPRQVRQLAAYVVGHEPEQLWWWEYRFTSWARLLEAHLGMAERRAPAVVRLRNSACPNCRATSAPAETAEGFTVTSALAVEFSREGYITEARCGACATVWRRGDELNELARILASGSS